MTENEFLLFDRLEVIKQVINEHGEDSFYIAFSGGKDSTILHHLIDMALPNNHIPRVFQNTGIEYIYIYQFVKELAEKDNRIVMLNSGVNIKNMLNKDGYPFKSKEHSLRVYYFNKGSKSKFIKKYLNNENTKFTCPNILRYQFKEKGKYNYSNLCCYRLKKEPQHKWAKENNKTIAITGMRKEEGGNRSQLGCIITDSKGKIKKFHPLVKVDEQWENWFIDKYKVELCKLYMPPFNFERTGCKGCPFNINLQQDLETMGRLLPNERKQCEILWKPVYEEYRRIGYRLKKAEEIKLF